MNSAEIFVPSEENITRAVEQLSQGRLVAIPTETVYGLAANATDRHAVAKIFAAKGRPPTNPLIVHIADIEQLSAVVASRLDPAIERQVHTAASLWPGPLTVVCPRSEAIPDEVTAGRDTVAVRIPDHPVALQILRRCPFPLAAPSANRSNYISPTRAEHVAEGLGGQVAMVIDGGTCRCGVESTIIALEPAGPRLLRPGAVTVERLQELFGDVLRIGVSRRAHRGGHDHGCSHLPPVPGAPRPTAASDAFEGPGSCEASDAVEASDSFEVPGSSFEAPGSMPLHYAPRTPLVFVENAPPGGQPVVAGRLAFAPLAEEESARYAQVETLSATGNLEEVARGLFAALLRLDRAGLDVIVTDTCSETGIGRAVMDRLRRAAARER